MDAKTKNLIDAATLALKALNKIPKSTITSCGIRTYDIAIILDGAIREINRCQVEGIKTKS